MTAKRVFKSCQNSLAVSLHMICSIPEHVQAFCQRSGQEKSSLPPTTSDVSDTLTKAVTELVCHQQTRYNQRHCLLSVPELLRVCGASQVWSSSWRCSWLWSTASTLLWRAVLQIQSGLSRHSSCTRGCRSCTLPSSLLKLGPAGQSSSCGCPADCGALNGLNLLSFTAWTPCCGSCKHGIEHAPFVQHSVNAEVGDHADSCCQ